MARTNTKQTAIYKRKKSSTVSLFTSAFVDRVLFFNLALFVGSIISKAEVVHFSQDNATRRTYSGGASNTFQSATASAGGSFRADSAGEERLGAVQIMFFVLFFVTDCRRLCKPPRYWCAGTRRGGETLSFAVVHVGLSL